MSPAFKRLKYACYTTNISMSVVSNLSPLLFVTFHNLYNISYSLLGLLVLINFFTQLTIDLIFSFFSHKFNIPLVVKINPLLTVAGLLIYALWPFFFADSVYLGLVIGTVVFACSGGLSEVLISPVIAAIPSENPEGEMSKLHSIYAWGVVGVILVSSAFLLLFGTQNWQYLALIFMLIPLVSAILFSGAKIPAMETPKKTSNVLHLLKNPGLWLCFFAMFTSGASECTMAQWCSGYIEQALGIPKIFGDIFGVALFSVMLGLGRSLYAKRGKNIERVLFVGVSCAAICYFTAAISSLPWLGLIACAVTGLCTSMLWPGCLLVASGRFPAGGVFVFAMMAAGGDMGAAIVPQLVGSVTDAVAANPTMMSLANSLALSPDQLGMKIGMLVGMLFPLIGIFLYLRILLTKKKHSIQNKELV
jgi:MFS family permease